MADTTGTGQAAIALTTSGWLKGKRSSKLPPPRATITTSTCPATRPIARAISLWASSPCTAVGEITISTG